MTALLELRPSYFERVHPLPRTPEQRARLSDGREWHAELGARLAPRPEQREVRLRREGIVGQVDWFESAPTELKTTAEVPPVDQLTARRPQYLDQLGMYCALAGVDHGTLMVVPSGGSPVEAAISARVEFGELDGIWSEMLRRADLLRAAEANRDPSPLPRCPWFGRGCAFRAADVCPCSGVEPEGGPLALGRVRRFARDADSEHALREALRAVQDQPASFPERFADLLYPRRAYYRRTLPEREPGPESRTRSESRDRLYRRIVERVEATDPKGQGRLLPVRGGVREPVPRMGGRPYLIKITRARPRPTTVAMLAEQSQYFLELGLRCQAVGAASGWLLMGYEHPGPDGREVVPCEVEFDPPDGVASVAAGREALLRRAVDTGRPDELPPCPGWMYDGCPYRDRCGCGSAVSPPNR